MASNLPSAAVRTSPGPGSPRSQSPLDVAAQGACAPGPVDHLLLIPRAGHAVMGGFFLGHVHQRDRDPWVEEADNRVEEVGGQVLPS